MITIEKSLALDLINVKLSVIVQEINNILNKWHYIDPDILIMDAKKGILDENAQNDAISLRNLLDIRKTLSDLKKSWVN